MMRGARAAADDGAPTGARRAARGVGAAAEGHRHHALRGVARLGAGLWLALAAAAACADDCRLSPADAKAPVQQLRDGPLTVAWAARPAPLRSDRHTELDIRICGAGVQGLKVDADMPAHRHGMNYAASVQAQGDGRFVARGLLFHMPGRWRLIFDVEAGGRTQRLTQAVDVR